MGDCRNATPARHTNMGDCHNATLATDSHSELPLRGAPVERSLNIFNKVLRSGAPMPATPKTEVQTKLGMFEILTAVVDAVATVPVMNPATGSSYRIVES